MEQQKNRRRYRAQESRAAGFEVGDHSEQELLDSLQQPTLVGYDPIQKEEPLQSELDQDLYTKPTALGYYSSYQSLENTHAKTETAYTGNNTYQRRNPVSSEPLQDLYVAEAEQEEEKPKPVKDQNHSGKVYILIAALAVVISCLVMIIITSGTEKKNETANPSIEETAVFEATPQPTVFIAAFQLTGPQALPEQAAEKIQAITKGIQLDPVAANEKFAVYMTQSFNGNKDYYVFSAEDGKLLCYFEDIANGDAFLQEDGNLFINQSPYVVTPSGKTVVTEERLQALYGKDAILHPFYDSWAVAQTADGKECGYIDADGNELTSMRFLRAYPFTGEYTLACMDTGNIASKNDRYVLYILKHDGTMTKWKPVSTPDSVKLCLMEYVFMNNGDVIWLGDPENVIFSHRKIVLYPDFNAFVVRNPQSEVLYVNGKVYGDSEYISVEPLESSMVWEKKEIDNITICSMTSALAVKPQSYTFVLKQESGDQFISLSVTNQNRVLRQGELYLDKEDGK